MTSYILLIFLTCREVEVCYNAVKRFHLDLIFFFRALSEEKQCCHLTYLIFIAFEILAKKINIFFMAYNCIVLCNRGTLVGYVVA